MKTKNTRFYLFKFIASTLSILLGVGCLVVALFAYQLGLDNNPTPGTLRKLLAGIGICLTLAPLLITAAAKLDQRFHLVRSIEKILKIKQNSEQVNSHNQSNFASHSKIGDFFQTRAAFWSVLGVALVILCSLWYITNGTMIHFTSYSNYYDLQADGFLAGQTSLVETPPAELASLTDPYDWTSRTGIRFIWDASYFEGKYYIYWGPVPAVVAALVKLVKPGIVEDQYLLLFFLSGLSVVLAALFHYLRKKYFPSVPAWTLTFFILLGGLSTPVFWLVNRPNVYETAIAACQFFLFLGIFAVIRGLNSNTKPWKWFLLAGLALGASVGSRTSIVITVFFIVGLALVMLVKKNSLRKINLGAVISLLVPLILFAGGLAWFNFVRFGSPLETGMRYQLTGEALPEDLSQLFAVRYILPNTYLSLLQPYQFTPNEFPFFISTTDNNWSRIIRIPENYYFAEQVTGILCTIPFLWFLILPVIRLLQKGWLWVKETPAVTRESTGDPTPGWLWILLGGTSLVSFVTNMMFVMTTMRYLADFVTLFILLTVVVVMFELERARYSRVGRVFILIALVAAILASIIISLLINFTCGDRRIQHNNPLLYEKIVEFFQ